MSSTGKPPKCSKCFSLERHRSNRETLNVLREIGVVSGKSIQFSEDLSVEPDWFDSYEISVYGGENSLDIQKIRRESNLYDFVICNHVLEHVPYDNSAMNELVRILSPDGCVYIGVPDPARKKTTDDWGYAKAEDHGHFRIYGEDIEQMFKKYIPNTSVIALGTLDPVTEMPDIIYLIFKTTERCREVFERLRQLGSFVRIDLI